MCKRLKMLFLPTFPSIKRQRIGSISFSNTHHIRLLLPNLTIWWGNTKMVYVPTTYQISPSSCHYYASSLYLWVIRNSSETDERRGIIVVNCFQICIFELLETAHLKEKTSRRGCELLSNLYLWVIRNSRSQRESRAREVVNCFQICIFELLETA